MANQATKSGNILGAIAALTVLLFGGWSGAFMGWLLGAGAGLMAWCSFGEQRGAQSGYLDLGR